METSHFYKYSLVFYVGYILDYQFYIFGLHVTNVL